MKNAFLVAGSLVPILLLLVVYIGDTYRQPLVTVSIFIGLMCALAAASAIKSDFPATKSAPLRFFAEGPTAWWIRGAAHLGLVMLVLLFSDRQYQFMVIFPGGTSGQCIAAVAAVCLLAFLVIKPPKPSVSLFVLLFAGLAVRLLWFSTWEINPAKRDMLALVISALEKLCSFHDPYGFHQMQRGSEVPLTYPPGLIIAHLPAFLAGIDIRWTAWLSDAIIVLGIGGYAVKHRIKTIGPVFAALSVYLFLPDIHWNGIYAEPHADWAVLTALFVAALFGRPLVTFALFGAALTFRPFNLVLFPLFAVWVFRNFDMKTCRRAFLIAGAAAAAFFVPFVLVDPDAFFSGTVRWLLDYGPAHRTWFYGMMSFSSILYRENLEHLMAPLQIAAVVITFGLAVWKLKTTRQLIAFSMILYGIFVSLNSIVWMSFWIGVCLISIILCAAAGDKESAKIGPQKYAAKSSLHLRSLAFEIFAAVCIVTSLITLLYLLYAHFDKSGRAEAKAYIQAELAPGDLVIDNSGYRKAILKTPYLLSKEELPKGALLAETPFQAKLPGRRDLTPATSKRIFAVERYGLFADKKPVYLGDKGDNGPYILSDTKTFGRYKVYLLTKRDKVSVSHRLSEIAADLKTTAGSEKKSSNGTFQNLSWSFGRGEASSRMRIEECVMDQLPKDMVSLSPLREIRYTVTSQTRGARWVTVLGGFPDRTASWHHAPVRLSIKTPVKDIAKEFVFPNKSGLLGATFEIPKAARDVTFGISTDSKENPKFCFDAVFYGVSP
jgi:hypothetical protein